MGFRRKLVVGSAVILASSLIVFILGITKSVIVARLLNDPDLIGLLGIHASLAAVFATIGSFGIPIALARYVAEADAGSETARRLVRISFLIAAFSSVLAGAALFALSTLLAQDIYRRSELTPLLQVGAVYVTVSCLGGAVSGALRGHGRMGFIAAVSIIQGLSLAGASAILILTSGVLGAAYALVASAVASGLLAAALLLRMPSGVAKPPSGPTSESRAAVLTVLQFSAPTVASGLLLYPAFLVVESYLSGSLSFHDLGLYRIGFGFYNLLVAIPSVMAVPLMPMIANLREREPDRVNQTFVQILRVLVVLVIPIGAGTALASRVLLQFLYGDVYAEADEVASFLVVAALYVAVTPVIQSLLLGTGKASVVLGLDAAWAVSFVPAAIVLVAVTGLTGVGYAFLLARIVLLFLMMAYLRNRVGIPLRSFGGPIGLLFATTGLLVALLVLVSRPTLTALSLPIALAFSVVGYRLLSREERAMLWQSILDVLPRRRAGRQKR